MSLSDTIDCPACKGAGELDSVACTFCDGDGRVFGKEWKDPAFAGGTWCPHCHRAFIENVGHGVHHYAVSETTYDLSPCSDIGCCRDCDGRAPKHWLDGAGPDLGLQLNTTLRGYFSLDAERDAAIAEAIESTNNEVKLALSDHLNQERAIKIEERDPQESENRYYYEKLIERHFREAVEKLDEIRDDVEKRAWLLIVGSDATDDPRVLSRLSKWLAEMAEDMAEAQGKDTCPVCHGTGQALFYCEDGSGRPRDGLCPVPCAYCGEAGQVDKPAHVTQWHRVKDLADFLGYEVNGTPDDDWLVTQAHTDDRGVRCADLDAVFKLLSEVKLPWE